MEDQFGQELGRGTLAHGWLARAGRAIRPARTCPDASKDRLGYGLLGPRMRFTTLSDFLLFREYQQRLAHLLVSSSHAFIA